MTTTAVEPTAATAARANVDQVLASLRNGRFSDFERAQLAIGIAHVQATLHLAVVVAATGGVR